MNGSNGRFQVFQRQLELAGVGLLGLAPEGCLLVGCDQILQPLELVVLRVIWASLSASLLAGRQHGLQGDDVTRRAFSLTLLVTVKRDGHSPSELFHVPVQLHVPSP